MITAAGVGVASAGTILTGFTVYIVRPIRRAGHNLEILKRYVVGEPAIGGTPATPGLVGLVAEHEQRLDQVEATVEQLRGHFGSAAHA